MADRRRTPHSAPRAGRGSGSPRASAYVRQRAAVEGGEARRVREALAVRGLSPRRRFGQNFLVREDVADRIVEHCHLHSDDVAVEIGAGAGALTLRLARRVAHLIAIEKDRGLAELLREELSEAPRVELLEADFLDVDLPALARAHQLGKLAIVGNIPYNI